ncbi:NAD-dependent epimerase/dehydratase family protein [Mobilicoccus pelagius]|uniref:Putative nucleotide-sugar epimerase n=1 Tax=Mobilicoccus pelagius NBRC 104925 TaxID=1089455 RepID=H5US33_9MICO|nr:NAD-dependent epimerase/dehydratase family protein [Mobilicoccus pelagius]GAB48541.1 putative nucleotide-sugar epimerase [Mobilicoccus pelagius NBRC 104925]
MTTTTVLVTGVSTYLGAGVARVLADRPEVAQVIGVDVMAPPFPLGEAEFLRADVRNPLLGRIVQQAGIDTLVHVGAIPRATATSSARTSAREAAVIGTMQLLGVCQAVPQLRHVVLASTGSVYGASPGTPAVVSEESPVDTRARSGHVRDAVEVESYVHAITQRRPDVGVSVLRLAHVFGPSTRSAMTNYLRAPVVPLPFGFDARVQALSEDDAVAALVAAAAGDPVGTVNVAGEGVLTLRQVVRIARRPTVPVFTTTGRALGALTRWAGIAGIEPDHVDYVMYGRCLDLTRMREVLRFTPEHTTREAIERFATDTWGVVPTLHEEAGGSRPIGARPEHVSGVARGHDLLDAQESDVVEARPGGVLPAAALRDDDDGDTPAGAVDVPEASGRSADPGPPPTPPPGPVAGETSDAREAR